MARFKIIEKQAEQTNSRFKIINPVEITQPITKTTNALETAKANYNAQLKKEAEQKSALKTKLESSGVTLGDNNFYTPNNLTTTKKNTTNALQNAITAKQATGKVEMPIDTLNADVAESRQNISAYKNIKDTSQEYKDYEKTYYETPLKKYQYDVEKVKSENYGFFDKTIGNLVGGLTSAIDPNRKYKDENGDFVTLPSYNELKAQKITEQSKGIGKIYQQVTNSIGNMIPSVVAGAVTGGLGLGASIGSLGATFINSANDSYNQALLDGKSKETAKSYGIVNGAVQVLTEKMFGGLGKAFGTGALDDVVVNRLTKNITNSLTKTLVSNGIKAIGEGTEELVSGLIDPIAQKLTGMSDEDLKTLYKNEDLLQQFLLGTITSIVMQTPSTISNLSSIKKTQTNTNIPSIQQQPSNVANNGLNRATNLTNNQVSSNNAIQTQLQTPTQTNTQNNTITPTTPQTSQGVAQIQPQGIIANTQPQQKTVSSQQSTITPQITTPQNAETRQRGVFSTALQNQNIPAEIKSGIKGANTDYIVITDNDALANAQQRITKNGYDKSLTALETKFNNNEKLSKYDVAEATLLYNDAFAKGDTQKALDILTSIAVAGTESGQVSQATSILQRATPDGRLLALQKQVNKINDKYKTNIKIDTEDMNNIKNAQNKGDLDKAINDAIVKISKQMPNTLANRLNEWRYLAMLGNPKTHIRNIVSNLAMKGTSKVKNTLSSFIEDTIKPTERTRTLEKPSKETIDFVNKDVQEQKSRIQGTDKYDQNKLGIKPTPMKLSALNSALLEWEDWKFSSGAYKDALSNYITANKIDVSNVTPQQIESARQYAIDQAQEQTFRQFSKLAESISRFSNKNKLVKLATDAVLPFKTTPINIAKTGIEYSPIGLAKTLTKNAIELKSGGIKPAKFIDNLSKGLTGTAITALGYALAEAGLLTASGSDEDKENYFQQMQGKQPYSIQIGGKNITLDWLSPSAMPFFMGAEISEMKKNGMDTNKLLNIANGISTIVDPLTEMSMLQGINSTLKSYDESALGGVVINALQNYALQYIPTISGQIARTLTPERKSTTGAGTGIEKKFNTFVNKVKAKIPVIANTLEPYTDQFGNKEITKSIAERAFQNFLSPAYIKTTKTEKVYKEIQELYDKTGENSILPTSSSRYFTQDGEKIYLTPSEYTKFNQKDGETVLKYLREAVNSSYYTNLTDEEKVKYISSIYSYGQKVAKNDYLSKK